MGSNLLSPFKIRLFVVITDLLELSNFYSGYRLLSDTFTVEISPFLVFLCSEEHEFIVLIKSNLQFFSFLATVLCP